MTDHTSLRSSIWVALASTLITVMLLAIAAEFAVRYRERNRSTVPGSMEMMFYRHHRLGHALVRDSDYFGWISVNDDGFRGSEDVVLPKPGGTFRVYVDGGSTTFDSFVSADSLAWPARLERRLDELLPGQNIEVINGGVPGYRIRDNLIRLLDEIDVYEPDLIVQLQGHNDLFFTLTSSICGLPGEPPTPGMVRTVPFWRTWLERNSLFYNKLVARWHAMSGSFGVRRAGASGPPPDLGARLDCGMRRFERDLGAYLGAAEAAGVPVVLLEPVHVSSGTDSIHESFLTAVPGADARIMARGYARTSSVLRRASRGRVRYIATSSFGLAGPQWYYDGDPIHFNDAGAHRMATMVARALVDAGVFADPTALAVTEPQPAQAAAQP
jgi:lysophospholipase L1-like esterase